MFLVLYWVFGFFGVNFVLGVVCSIFFFCLVFFKVGWGCLFACFVGGVGDVFSGFWVFGCCLVCR